MNMKNSCVLVWIIIGSMPVSEIVVDKTIEILSNNQVLLLKSSLEN